MKICSRRQFLALAGTVAAGALTARAAKPAFRLRYVLSTNQYGTLPVAEILPQVRPAGCDGLDVWAGRWGNQREQIDAMGHDRFAAMLKEFDVKVSCYTCMHPGFIKSEPHLRDMLKFGGSMIVAGFPSGGPGAKELRGSALKQGIRASAEKLKPIIAVAGELGVRLAIENHLNGLLETPESLTMLVDAIPEKHVGVAFAPFHLPQNASLLGRLVGDLGERLFYFYAWQYGDGSGDLPPSRQKLQLPGVGPLDFRPMLAALKRNNFAGYTSIFMHPTPRGAPLHSTAAEVTAELNKARAYLERELAWV